MKRPSLTAVVCLSLASGACAGTPHIQLTSAYSGNLPGSTGHPPKLGWQPGNPTLGGVPHLVVNFQVSGNPSLPFPVLVSVPGKAYEVQVTTLSAGTDQQVVVPLTTHEGNLDGDIPYKVWIDPFNTIQEPGFALNQQPYTRYATGTFTPVPPPRAVERYQTKTLEGIQSCTVTMSAAPTLAAGFVALGYQETTSHSELVEEPTTMVEFFDAWGAWKGAQFLSPTAEPLTNWEHYYRCDLAPYLKPKERLVITEKFKVNLSRVRVNKDLLDQVPWSQEDDLMHASFFYNYVRATPVLDKDSPEVSNFVVKALGSAWRSTFPTPYRAARKLFTETLKALTYVAPYPAGTDNASGALRVGKGDCGTYSQVLAASLRHIGIPARMVQCTWINHGGTHVWVEFYLMGCGWIPADPSVSDIVYPNNAEGFYFGNCPHINIAAPTSCGTHLLAPIGNGTNADWEYFQSPLLFPGDAASHGVAFSGVDVDLHVPAAP